VDISSCAVWICLFILHISSGTNYNVGYFSHISIWGNWANVSGFVYDYSSSLVIPDDICSLIEMVVEDTDMGLVNYGV
jgi:hypothetical protein